MLYVICQIHFIMKNVINCRFSFLNQYDVCNQCYKLKYCISNDLVCINIIDSFVKYVIKTNENVTIAKIGYHKLQFF